MKEQKKMKRFGVAMCGFLATVTFAGVTLFTSCTDDELAGGQDTPENTDAERLLVNNDIAELSKRVTLFKTDGMPQTRAVTTDEGYMEMPKQPGVPDNAVDMMTIQDWQPSGNVFVLPKGATKTSTSLNLNGAEWYIAGNLTLENHYNKGIIYILPGGTLDYKIDGLSNVEIYNYGGTFIHPDDFTVAENTVYMTTGDFSAKNLNAHSTLYVGGHLNVEGTMDSNANGKVCIIGNLAVKTLTPNTTYYIGGNLEAETLQSNQDGKIRIVGSATIKGNGQSTIEYPDVKLSSSTMIVSGKLTAPRFEVNTSGYVLSECGAEFSESLYVTNQAQFITGENGSIESPVTNLDSNGYLAVSGKGFLNLGEVYIGNADGASIEVKGEYYSVVKATSIEVNMTDLKPTFAGYMGLHYESFKYGGSVYSPADVMKTFAFQSNIRLNGEDTTSIPASGECNPGFNSGSTDPDPENPGGGEEGGGEDPDPDQPGGGEDPDPENPGGGDEGDDDDRIVIDHVAEIESPDHAHDISATCVYMEENSPYAYVSWHKRGEEYDGCAEVIQFTDDKTLQLVSFMRSERRRDFNHCIVDKGTLYLVGGQGTGGIMAHVKLENNIFPSSATETIAGKGIFDVVKFPGSADANCVVRNDNYYMVAATGGFYTLDASDLGNVQMVQKTPGSAKFIDLNNGKMLTLNLDARGAAAAGAQINVYADNDYTLSTSETTIEENEITPINGKNVARLDGENVYVCLGENGLQRYTNGTQNGNFKLDGTNSLVNGMDFDENYIYVAYGNKGLYVLDKETLKEVASYRYSGGKSANYVKVVNGHIFVAYGRSGLQVFKLTKVKN